MRVVFFGSGDFAVPSLHCLVHSPHEPAAVVTAPDRPAGRGRKPLPTSVAGAAGELGLPVLRCEDVNTPEFIDRLRQVRAVLGLVIAFRQKLLAPLRSVLTHGCINLHASLLPRWRGAAPIAWAMLAGDSKTGVTVFRLIDRMDAGPILVQRETMIRPHETAGELHDRLARIGCDAVRVALEMLDGGGGGPDRPQVESQATRAPKLMKSDGDLRFDEPAERIALRCRAMTPWPGARCRYAAAAGGAPVELTLTAVTAISSPASAPPGTITAALTVAAAGGTLDIHSLCPAGKRIMGWQDFVNGWHVKPGDRLERITA